MSVNLKPVEIGILILSPSTGRTQWRGEDQKIAHRLVKRGVLVSDPTEPSVFRCTENGMKVLRDMMKPHGP